MTHHAHERVTSHMNKTWLTAHVTESCHKYECYMTHHTQNRVKSHIWMLHDSCMSNITHINNTYLVTYMHGSCHTMEYNMTHHTHTHMHGFCHTYECNTTHRTNMHESCYKYKWTLQQNRTQNKKSVISFLGPITIVFHARVLSQIWIEPAAYHSEWESWANT